MTIPNKLPTDTGQLALSRLAETIGLPTQLRQEAAQ
jgi:hypothetical protein